MYRLACQRNGRLGKTRGCSRLLGAMLHVERLSAYDNTIPAGSLRSADVTRLLRYYGPLRLPAMPNNGYEFPSSVGRPRCIIGPTATRGLPGSSIDLSATAVPYHPGELNCCTYSLLRSSHEASPSPEGWPLPMV